MSSGDERVSYTRMLVGGTAAALAVGAALTGCASSGAGSSAARPTVASLVHTVRDDFRHVKSLRMAGHLRQDGRQVALDLRMLRSGEFEGTVVLSGARIRVLRSGSSTYAFVSRSFFRYLHITRNVPAGACSVICGKYIKLPVGAIPRMGLATLAKQITKEVSLPMGNLRMTVTTFAGQPAYEVTHAGQSAFFAKNGHHYLIGFRYPRQNVAITLSQWNSVPPISPPPASKIVTG